MKKTISVLMLMSVFLLASCTNNFAVKNKALVLSVEKFDNEVVAHSKDMYPDPEQQKMFSDFIKKNTKVEIDNVEVKDEDGSADLAITTPKQSVYPELKGISGKDWKAKIDANMEVRKFKLTLKNIKKSWEVLEQKPVPAT
ncbi:MAG: hypothetical protein EOP04_09220 [Proteobacteria bacterium]|nr:MAG: hypothetical protein EOP04_09220 [Pseudomonadota bacterium]